MKNRWHFMIMVFLFVWGCQKDPTAITKNDSNQPPPGPHPPREYVWTVDTLTPPDIPQNILYDIWGSSATDVYTVGSSAVSHGKIYHYNGSSWRMVKPAIPNPLYVDLSKIYGFSADNIYIAGLRSDVIKRIPLSLLLHFNGQQWQEIPLDGKGLQAVWGGSALDLWVGGIFGTLQHFDGNTWTKYSIPDSIYFKDFAGFASDDVYALAYSVDLSGGPWTYFVFHWDGHIWSVQDSYVEYREAPSFGRHRIKVIGDYLYSVGYDGVFRKGRTEESWEKIFSSSTLLFGICGSAPDNIFVVGRGGRAYHFNGVDWYQYKEIAFPDIEYAACWTDGVETFIVGDNGSKSIVLHGR